MNPTTTIIEQDPPEFFIQYDSFFNRITNEKLSWSNELMRLFYTENILIMDEINAVAVRIGQPPNIVCAWLIHHHFRYPVSNYLSNLIQNFFHKSEYLNK